MTKPRFVFIDDHPQNRKQWLQWAKRNEYDAYAVESAYEAKEIPADIYMFDVSACGAGVIRPESAYSPICTLAELFPGAIFVIISGIAKSDVESIIDDVKEHLPDVNIVYGGWGTYEDFEKAIKLYL